VSGIAHEGRVAAGLTRPKHLPSQAIDHATGYLAAFGAMVALGRRARDGGSYLVRLSLAQTGRGLDGLGRVDGMGTPDLRIDDIGDVLEQSESPFGRLRYVVPAARLSVARPRPAERTSPFWRDPVPVAAAPPASAPAGTGMAWR